jgi:hypothetical protein
MGLKLKVVAWIMAGGAILYSMMSMGKLVGILTGFILG